MEQCEKDINVISEETEQKILKKVMDLGDDIKDYAIYQDIVDDNQLENWFIRQVKYGRIKLKTDYRQIK